MKEFGNRFNKIKKKHVLFAIVKSAVCALSLGLTAVGVLLLALKLSATTIAAIYYVLIGVGVALISGGALYLLLFRPTDRSVAKRTDDDYSLDERVQTALAYSGRSGTMIEMQRADAEEKITALPARKFSFARIWQFFVIFAIALAIGVAGIIVPAKAATEDGEEFFDPDSTPRQVTELELAGVRELISNVDSSTLDQTLKTSVGEILYKLLDDLDEVSTEGMLKTAVYGTIEDTGSLINSTLSYIGMGAALAEADQSYLGQAITNGGNVYRFFMLTIYDEVRDFNSKKYDTANVKIVNAVTSLRTTLTVNDAAEIENLLDGTVNGIMAALSSAGVSEEEGLYIYLHSLAEGLSEIKSHTVGVSNVTTIHDEISELFTKFTVNATGELSNQAYSAAMRVFIANRLKNIFGYLPLELPIDDPDRDENGKNPDSDKGDDGEDGDGENSENNNHGGSSGTGEMEYGSDDMVWVPGRGYMKYGEIIKEYYTLISRYLHSEDLTEEQKNMISLYYDILFGSNKNKQ